MTDKKEQTYIDKTDWPNGAWKDEPDRVSWVDPATGFDCLLRRSPNSFGWCGYVSIHKGHPLYGKGWADEGVCDLEIHGGITYGEPCDEDPIKGICHLSESRDDAWWLGFDCGHANDISPRFLMDYEAIQPGGKICLWEHATYKDIDYVISEVESLAAQLKEAESGGE